MLQRRVCSALVKQRTTHHSLHRMLTSLFLLFRSLCAALNKRDCLLELQLHISSLAHHIRIDEIEGDLRTSHLLAHFLYRSDASSQIVMCLPELPYAANRHLRKQLFRKYQHILSRIGAAQGEIVLPSSDNNGAQQHAHAVVHQQKKHQIYFEMSEFANIFCCQYCCERSGRCVAYALVSDRHC